MKKRNWIRSDDVLGAAISKLSIWPKEKDTQIQDFRQMNIINFFFFMHSFPAQEQI